MKMWLRGKQIFFDITEFSPFDRGILLITRRNLLASLKNRSKLNWLAYILVPLFSLAALGKGLGVYVQFQKTAGTYLEYIFPAMLVLTVTFISYREMLSHSFSNANQKNLWRSSIDTPITLTGLALGEILWATTVSFSVVLVIFLFGQIIGIHHSLGSWLCLPVLFLMAWLVSAFTMALTQARFSERRMDFYFVIFILPGALFGETLFPLESWPTWFQTLAALSPITHAVKMVRVLFVPEISSSFLFTFSLLFLITWILTNLSVARFKRRVLLELVE
jgi:lipooligosaccharide transport system permease protein